MPTPHRQRMIEAGLAPPHHSQVKPKADPKPEKKKASGSKKS